jgi:hypothetical protein
MFKFGCTGGFFDVSPRQELKTKARPTSIKRLGDENIFVCVKFMIFFGSD